MQSKYTGPAEGLGVLRLTHWQAFYYTRNAIPWLVEMNKSAGACTEWRDAALSSPLDSSWCPGRPRPAAEVAAGRTERMMISDACARETQAEVAVPHATSPCGVPCPGQRYCIQVPRHRDRDAPRRGGAEYQHPNSPADYECGSTVPVTRRISVPETELREPADARRRARRCRRLGCHGPVASFRNGLSGRADEPAREEKELLQ